jgi:hypothetical protein
MKVEAVPLLRELENVHEKCGNEAILVICSFVEIVFFIRLHYG